MNSPTLIMKFGGAAVATTTQMSRLAEIILQKRKVYSQIVVVVSAMGNTTDQLISLAKEVHPHPPEREYDMLLTVGERISMSLLAMALARQKQAAFSFTGSQTGIITTPLHTNARIIDVRPHRIKPYLERGDIVIVAGFQGVSRQGEITTLGRGGSDTTAVALGIALQADKVEFYKDVDGIYPADPKFHPCLEPYAQMNYEEALALVQKGAKILHDRCILLAQKNCLPLHVKTFLPGEGMGTLIHLEGALRPPVFDYETEENVPVCIA